MNSYSSIIHKTRYARWLEDKQRRETWEETVKRYIYFWINRYNSEEIDYETLKECEQAILNMEVMPSMRCLMTAGPALERDNVAGFNCSFAGIDNVLVFDEIMYVLLCGTGVGFSVERDFTDRLQSVGSTGAAEALKTEILIDLLKEFDPELLPIVGSGHHYALRKYYEDPKYFTGVPKEELSTFSDNCIRVRDSKYGWASAFRILCIELFNGNYTITWNTDLVRPAGSKLRTFGGRASGPAPLEDLFRFTVKTFKQADNRKLNSLECHDLVCKIADIVVVGGVRRSALISLSNLTDERLRVAKSGAWWNDNPQRALANNSACYTEKPDMHIFMREWRSLYDSKSGERGIFSRAASQRAAARNGRRDSTYNFGTNPCSEIILRSKQFCNLSEVCVRPDDTLQTLKQKVRIASILGTLQATLTNFVYLSPEWKENTEQEALLGVSLTGIMDHPILNQTQAGVGVLERWLQEMKEVAIETNKEWANKLGINRSAAITCVKPSGTVSQLVNTASGIHTRHSKFYLRTIRQDNKDPITQFLKDKGVYNEPSVGKEDTTTVFYFPIKAPDNALTRKDINAVQHLKLWKVYQENWCEHKPSITVSVQEDEWLEVGAWVYKNFDDLSGVSFLPYDGGTYQQAPYQEITEEEYNEWKKKDVEINWEEYVGYETSDQTTGTQELACSASGGCEL